MDTDLLKKNLEVEDFTDSISKLVMEDVNHEETHVLKKSLENGDCEETSKLFAHQSVDNFLLPDLEMAEKIFNQGEYLNDEESQILKKSPENDDFEETSMSSAHQSEGNLSPPDHELTEKILNQVEYFFSNDNIWKDKFLLKHILHNKEGYVNIKLLTSLNKVKALTKDWKVVAHILKNSDKLEMNEEMTKVRRIIPLSDTDNPANSASVMVFELPSKVKTSDDVKDLLKPFGPVSHASLMSSNSNTLSPNTKRWLSFYKHISSTTFAVAKFQSAVDAVEATKHVPKQGFIVVPLMNEDYSKLSPSHSPNDSENSLLISDDKKETEGSCATPSPSRNESSTTRKSRRDTPRYISQGNPPTLSCRHKIDSPINSSWKQRRQPIGCDQKRVIATRQPRGPDGTIGFHAGRFKMSLPTVKLSDFEI